MQSNVRSDGRHANRLLDTLTEPQRSRIARISTTVELKNHTELVRTSAPIEAIYFPLDCLASTLTELAEGDAIEVGLMGNEGITGLSLLLGKQVSSTTVIVQVPGTAVRIDAADFMREVVESDSEFRWLLLRYADAFMAMIAQTAACNATHSLEQRLARWLLMSHDRVGRDTIPMTHEFLALMLGVRRATVTQAAGSLRLAGAITYETGSVTVADRAKLQLAVCGCYGANVDLIESIFETANV